MASIQEIVARRAPVASLPQASPNPNVGVGLISDAGSAGFRQVGQVRGISLDTATGFGQAMAADAQTVGMVGQAVDEITTAVDKLNETNEKTRLSNAISLADAKLKEWNSISDPELKNEFELKQLRPAYNAISTERESLKPIALNARNILDSEKNVLLNADLANKSTSISMVELFKLEENIRKAKDLNEFSAGSQRYTAHVYGMLDSGLLTVAQSTSIMTRSRGFLRNQETFQLNSAYENGIRDLSANELADAMKTIKDGGYVLPKDHPLRPVEEFLDKTPSSRFDSVSRLFNEHLKEIEAENKYYEAEETASYRRAIEQDFPALRESLNNIISDDLTDNAFKKILNAIEPIAKKYKGEAQVINRLNKLQNDTIRNAKLIREANDSDLIASVHGFLNEENKSGKTFGQLIATGDNVTTIKDISTIIENNPKLQEKFEKLASKSVFDDSVILNRMQSELLKSGSVYNNFVDAYTKDRQQTITDATARYDRDHAKYGGFAYRKERDKDAVVSELVKESNKITDNAQFRKWANEYVDGALGVKEPRKAPEDPTIEIEVAGIVEKAIKVSIPERYEGMVDVANLSEMKPSEPVAVLNKKGIEYLKGLPRDQKAKDITELNKLTIRTKQIIESATSADQLSIPGPVTRGEVQAGDKAFAMESIYDRNFEQANLPEAKPRQAPFDELRDRNRAEYIESGKQPFDMSTSKVLDSLSEFRKENPQEYAAIEQLAISRDQLQGPQKPQINYITENISEALNNIGENALNLLPEGVKDYAKGLVDFWSNAITPFSQGVSEAGATELSSPTVQRFDSGAKRINLPEMTPRTPTLTDLEKTIDSAGGVTRDIRSKILKSNKMVYKSSTDVPQKDKYYGDDAVKKYEEMKGPKYKATDEEKLILRFEGLVDAFYLDTEGVMTYGVGQTGDNIFDGKKPSIEKFSEIIPIYRKRAKDAVGETRWAKLTQKLKNSLTLAAFRGDIKGSHQTAKKIKSGNYKEAAKHFIDNWSLAKALGYGGSKEDFGELTSIRKKELGIDEKSVIKKIKKAANNSRTKNSIPSRFYYTYKRLLAEA